MSLSVVAKQTILRQQMQASFPYLIKITWADGTSSYYCNSDENITFNSQTYNACVFSVTLPDVKESNFGKGNFKFSRLGNNSSVIRKVRENHERAFIEITGAIRYKNGSSFTIESIYDVEFYLTNPTWGDDTDVSFTLSMDDNLELQMPCDDLDEITCAGVA